MLIRKHSASVYEDRQIISVKEAIKRLFLLIDDL